ncbi:hemerythrin domain-containing protein [Myxococcus sp. RHSTA-1-4]|uniref:hemerythrin domain-containing protein n=1 Tax=Myxococcus sp. RHSTA-1-4 TaxID=2874601 RepID=UPI001CC0BABA|nr:hemerythrin domain-containing protein [Myxococcus sp. RHSTA-1-4]MBZ4416916.1 hemerythrin domain-containing protein [Myxococcus sp. RHSTA-1-4]
MTAMDALDVLTHEHRQIQHVLDLVARAVERGKQGEFVSASLFLRAANFFLTYVDGSHHAKEMVLFQTMLVHRLPLATSLLSQVSGEHGTGTEQALALRDAAEAALREGADPEPMLTAAEAYLRLQQGHTTAEETQVFPLARRLLPANVLERMRTRFARIEASHGSLAEAVDAMERAFAPARPPVRPLAVGGVRSF